jgi:hypothetical protein
MVTLGALAWSVFGSPAFIAAATLERCGFAPRTSTRPRRNWLCF